MVRPGNCGNFLEVPTFRIFSVAFSAKLIGAIRTSFLMFQMQAFKNVTSLHDAKAFTLREEANKLFNWVVPSKW